MITPIDNPNMPTYDPLATQFMTGGQMGYMPQAQFLTPSQYGAFRTLPTAQVGGMPLQSPSMMQAWINASQGSLGFMPKYTFGGYNPMADQSMFQAMNMRRMQDAQSSIWGSAANFGIQMGAGAAIGAINPILGVAAAVGMPSLDKPYIDRLAQARSLQAMTMGKITFGSDVAGGLGQGLGMGSARRLDESIRGQSVSDLIFRESDYRELTKLGIEHGMFDYSNNVGQYKQIIKRLRDNVNVMQELLGTSDFKELMGGMKRLLTMGTDVNQMTGVVQQERMFSRMTGMRHDQMVNTFGQQGALSYSQAGLTNYQGSLAAMSAAANVTIAQRLGTIDAAYVARHGGVSGMVQDEVQYKSQGINAMKNLILPFLANSDFSGIDANKLKLLQSGGMNLEALTGASARIKDAGTFSNYLAQSPELLRKLGDQTGPVGMDTLMMQFALMVGNASGGTNRQDSLRIGYMQGLGYDAEKAEEMASRWTNPEFINANAQQLDTERRRTNMSALAQHGYENTWYRKFFRSARESIYALASPYKTLADRAAQEKQFEEDAKLGVFGISRVSVGGLDKIAQGQLGGYLHEDVLGGRTSWGKKDAYEEMGTLWDRLRYLGNSEEMERGIGVQYRTLAQAAQANMSSADVNDLLKSLGISVGAFEQSVSSGFKSASSLGGSTEENVLIRALRTSGMELEDSKKKAKELMQRDDVREAMYSTAKRGNRGFAADITEEFRDAAERASSRKFASKKIWEGDITNRLGELTQQSWGIFGIDDANQTATLRENLYKDGRSGGVHSLAQLAEVYNNIETRPEDRKKVLSKAIEVGKRLGMSAEEIKAYLEDGSAAGAALLQEKTGMSAEMIASMSSIGRSALGDINSKSAGKAIASADSMTSITKDMFSRSVQESSNHIATMFGEDFDYSALSDPDKVKKLLVDQSLSSSKRRVYEAALQLQGQGQEVSLANLAITSGVGGLQFDALQGFGAKEGQEDSLEILERNADTLRTLANTQSKLDNTLKSLVEELRNMQRPATGFSLFGR